MYLEKGYPHTIYRYRVQSSLLISGRPLGDNPNLGDPGPGPGSVQISIIFKGPLSPPFLAARHFFGMSVKNNFFILVLIVFLVGIVTGSTDTCEKIDGDCPDDCIAAGYDGTANFNAKLNISPFHPDIERQAAAAEEYILSQGDVKRLDSPLTGLHTSIYYFCCYTQQEKATIKHALHDMDWAPFMVEYDSFSCNLDHNNETVYLHALPSDQDALFNLGMTLTPTPTLTLDLALTLALTLARTPTRTRTLTLTLTRTRTLTLARTIESTVRASGIAIPTRETLFHMTLARVGYDYPTDEVVEYFLDSPEKWYFGNLTMKHFHIENDVYSASVDADVHL